VGTGNIKPEDAELKRLQKELEDVKEERDILKKALIRRLKRETRQQIKDCVFLPV